MDQRTFRMGLFLGLLLTLCFFLVGATSYITVNDGVGTAKVKTISKSEAGNTVHLQGTYLDTDDIDFGGGSGGTTPEQLFNNQTSVGTSIEYVCEGKQNLIFKVEYNDAAATATFRVWRKDNNGTPMWFPGATLTPANTGTSGPGVAEAGYVHGTAFSDASRGCYSIKLEIISLSTADAVSVWVDGV